MVGDPLEKALEGVYSGNSLRVMSVNRGVVEGVG